MKSVTWAKCQKVIICYEHIGKGTDDDPVRELVVVRDKEGNFIAEHDPHERNTIHMKSLYHRLGGAMEERDYVIATGLARLRIASYVLREVMIPDDMGDRMNYILIDAIAGINHLADFFQRNLD